MVAGVFFTMIAAAQADQPTYEFRVPQLLANEALNLLAQQAGVPLLYPHEAVRKIVTNPVNGRYSLSEALVILFGDTGLIGKVNQSGVLTITVDRQPDAAMAKDDKREGIMFDKKEKSILTGFAGALFAGLFGANHAVAQDAGDVSSGVIEEVVVTAQKRSESIQDIPFAITALSQDALDRAGISSLEEFAYKVPGLAVSGQSNGRTQLNIRGINSDEVRRDNTRVSETVGIYFDEIPLSTALYNPDLAPFDLARVEVLRGPQGTLYGSGSLAGTIRLVSRAPVMDEFEGLIDAGFASVKSGDVGYSVKGMVNLPLSEGAVAARIAAYQVERAGWIDNLSDGPGGNDDVNKNNKWGIRASLLWTPTDRLAIRPTYIHQVTDNDGTAADNVDATGVQRLVTVGTLSAAQAFDPSGKYEQWKYLSQFHDDEVDIVNLLINYDFDNFEVTSSSSYTERDLRVFANISDSNLGGGFFPAPPPATGGSVNVLGVGLDDLKSIESFAQEVRLTSTHAGDFQWIAGVYYSDIDVDYHQPLGVTDPRGISGSPLVAALYSDYGEAPGILLRTRDDLSTEQVAVFGEVTYRFAERVNATAGLRWFDVSQDFNRLESGRLTGSASLVTTSSTTKDDGFNPRFLLSYEATEDVLLSAQAAKGFRLGGPQLFVPTVATPTLDCPSELAALGAGYDPDGFDSETLWNYELAVKSTLMDGTAQFNASAFLIDYNNLQITTRLNCGFSFTDNAEGAESVGIEFEFQAVLAKNLTLGFGGSYTDTELDADLSSREASKGDELIYVPNVKLNAFIDWSRPVTDTLTGYFSLNYQYTGEVEMFYPNSTRLPGSRRNRTADEYHTANLRVGVEAEKWELALVINNIWNEYATTYVDSINPGGPGGWVTDTTIRPRTIGLNAKYRF
jgi:iron complex outermembrane receptor protein